MKLAGENPSIADAAPAADPLAQRTFATLAAPAPPPDPEAQAQAAAEQAANDAAMSAVKQGIQQVLLVGLRMLRAAIAKRLPEIRDEWSDDTLQAPAEAAVPLLEKHLNSLMQIVGANPELAAFAIACMPLGMGYMQAVDRHRKTIEMQPGDGAAAPA